MKILHKEDPEFASFYIEENKEVVAEIGYSIENEDRLIIHHTYVDESLAGKGIGKQLVDKAVDYARQKGLRVVPMCSFAAKVMKAEGYKDVLG